METANNPQWIPYIPQPRTREERIVYFFKRYGFTGACVALGLVIALVLIFFQEPLSKEPPQEEPSAALMLPLRSHAYDSSSIGPNEETTMLSVTSRPDGATVLLNRDTLGTTPLRNYKLRTGAYLLTVEKEGYAQADSVILLRRDAAPEVVVRFDGDTPAMAVQREDDSLEQREVGQPAPAQASATRSPSTERTLHRPAGWQESEEQRRTRIDEHVREALERSGPTWGMRTSATEEQPTDTTDTAQTEADTTQAENEQSAEKEKKRIGW